MQFMPTYNISSADVISSGILMDASHSMGMTLNLSEDTGFAETMQEALEEVKEDEQSSVSRAMANGGLITGPYNKVSNNNVTYTLEEVTFSKTELATLREQLLKSGAPSEALENFDILANQPDGATLAQVLASLQIMGKEPSFTEREIQDLKALMSKFDPAGELGDKVINLMRNGMAKEALGEILVASKDLTTDLSKQDVALLAKGLNLPKEISNKMLALFGDAESLTLNAKDMATLFASAGEWLTNLANKQAQLDEAAAKTVKNIVQQAMARMQKEQEAEALHSRQVERSKTKILDSVTEETERNLNATLDRMATNNLNEKLASENIVQDRIAQVANQSKLTEGEKINDALSRNADSELPNVLRNAMRQFSEGWQNGNQENSDSLGQQYKQQGGWGDLLNKIEAQASQMLNRSGGVLNTAFAAMTGLANNANQFVQQVGQQIGQQVGQMPAYISQQMAQQVQNGLFSAMQNGATRLELQLHPAELGALSITLMEKSGEVTATVKAENKETVQALQQQVETIRTQLEQQGLKIEKLEVQLQNQQDNRQDLWSSLQQHNLWQDQSSRQEELGRLRNLAKVSRENLAQGVSEAISASEYLANNNDLRLHVVA